MMFLVLRPIFPGTQDRGFPQRAASPRRGGAQEIFGAVSENLSGGTGKYRKIKTGKSIDKAG